MQRRDFLRSSATASLLSLGGGMLVAPNAQAATGKTLIVIFQRGGNDGINTIVPFGDPFYSALRPTIGIAAPDGGPNAALSLAATPTNGFSIKGRSATMMDLQQYFGFHPGLDAIKPIWDAQQMAVMPAVGYPQSDRSHFEAQQIVETASPQMLSLGWLNNYLQSTGTYHPLKAVCFDYELKDSLRGPVPVSTISDLSKYQFDITNADATQEQAILDDIAQLYSSVDGNQSELAALLKTAGSTGISDLNLINSLPQLGSYTPRDGVVYPDNEYGKRLSNIAQLLKNNIGLEVATLDIGGWDSHSHQGGSETDGEHYTSLRNLSQGIRALYDDLGTDAMQNVCVLAMTEFGRTAEENASFGTDHGDAATWFMVGGPVQPGFHGGWPGLAEADLNEGRYLAPTLDFRNVLGDVVEDFLLSSNVNSVVGNHSYQKVGLFR